MTPTHTNKKGARYRYYVSHALLQKDPDRAGSVSRVPAPEIEAAVVGALRSRNEPESDSRPSPQADDRELIDRLLERVVIRRNSIELTLREDGMAQVRDGDALNDRQDQDLPIVNVPWTPNAFSEVKGILHSPATQNLTMSQESRDALILAIAKARAWVDDLAAGRVVCFADIAKSEGKVERHIRLLAPLAFVPPPMVTQIIHGTAPLTLTVTGLAKRLAYSWADEAS